MYTTPEIVEIGNARDLVLNMTKALAQLDDDDFLTHIIDDFDE